MMQADAENLFNHKILVEQVKLLYKNAVPIFFVNLVVSTALVYGLWDVVSRAGLSLWWAIMLLLFLLRVLSYVIYRKKFNPGQAHRYALLFIVGTGLTGLSWGLTGVVFFPAHALEYQLFILFVLIGMAAGAVSSMTIYLPAFLTYLPISLIPITIRLIMVAEPIQLSLGIMAIAYNIALLYFGLTINRAHTETLKLRFENSNLVEQLRQQKDEAEQANIAKTKFLAAASHDLRQPLHALTLFISVLDETIIQPKTRRVVEQIKSSVQALQGLFNALLDISRLEAGVMTVEKTAFALQPLLNKLANEYTPLAHEKGLNIYWPTESYTLYSDQGLIEQVLRNYISNAMHYTEQGEIHISCQPEGKTGQLILSVADTGIGIAEQHRYIIFEEFYQLGNPERDRSKGLGLGLAIVQRTAQLLGHDYGVQGRPEGGSLFFISVELSDYSVALSRGEAEQDHVPTLPASVLILVIDDDMNVLEGSRLLLSEWGCEVITAASKQEALAQLEQARRMPEGIIADYRLRDNLTGVDAVQSLQQHYQQKIPALIITGDIEEDRLRLVSASGLQILHKPAPPAKLRAFVNAIKRAKK
ncbi:hybrid sensor histidine kinase/response regulator [Dasania marina]|uniref:hybrid sensor histidine kinase/response regulator n=1 Tax=Dasania marina TaxID=471499 RepID=UPI000380F945|nr:hybrid sensor histidine kinase/response regulator [Dasania marina]